MNILENLKERLTIENLQEIVYIVNGYNDELDYLHFECNDKDFYDIYYYSKPEELARAIYFGSFNYNDEFIRINDLGNIETRSEYEYHDLLDDNRDDIIRAYLDILKEDQNLLENDKFLKEEEKEEVENYG